MRDEASIPILNMLHPKFINDLREFIEECEQQFNITIRIVQGLRSFAQQDALYAIGRTVKGNNASPSHPMGDVVTNAPGGESNHNYGLAADLADLEGKKFNWNFDYGRLFNIAQQ